MTFLVVLLILIGISVWPEPSSPISQARQQIELEKPSEPSEDGKQTERAPITKEQTKIPSATDIAMEIVKQLPKQPPAQEKSGLKERLTTKVLRNVKQQGEETRAQPKPSESISVAFLYRNRRIEIHNLGRAEFLLWGTKLGDRNSDIERAARIVTPEPFHYYLDGEKLENFLVAKIGDNGELRVPFYIFVEDLSKQKFTIKCELWAVVRDRIITIHMQHLGLTAGWLE